jgi:transposase
VLRQQAIKAVRDGQTATSVAAAFRLNVRTVFTWLAKFSDDGEEALLAKPIRGILQRSAMRKCSGSHRRSETNTPQQFGFDYALWTLSLIAQLINRQFGKSLSLAAVSRVMKLLGFLAQKPLCQAWQQDAAMVRRWETETYQEIRAQARSVGARVYFADEAGIGSDYHTGTTWAPVGETPVVTVTGRRFSLNMISAVSPRGDFRFMVHDGSVTSSIFKEFLERLMIGATRTVFVIVDGHPIHKSRLVQAYVDGLDGQLKLFCLPPYSPHLNPDEQVWAHVKRRVSNQSVQAKDDMKKLAFGALRRIQKLPRLVKSFFQ